MGRGTGLAGMDSTSTSRKIPSEVLLSSEDVENVQALRRRSCDLVAAGRESHPGGRCHATRGRTWSRRRSMESVTIRSEANRRVALPSGWRS